MDLLKKGRVTLTKSPVGKVSEFSMLRATFFLFNLKKKAMKETTLQQKYVAASRKHSRRISMNPWACPQTKIYNEIKSF